MKSEQDLSNHNENVLSGSVKILYIIFHNFVFTWSVTCYIFQSISLFTSVFLLRFHFNQNITTSSTCHGKTAAWLSDSLYRPVLIISEINFEMLCFIHFSKHRQMWLLWLLLHFQTEVGFISSVYDFKKVSWYYRSIIYYI